ncbi:hypothetical protein Scep_014982 [Stephania cephalantha]|uniref:Uncharacterized protein n=1 Tax=Stephania cephalantha TaxID=152367 RepID=A0AAP0J4W3_9MAGN
MPYEGYWHGRWGNIWFAITFIGLGECLGGTTDLTASETHYMQAFILHLVGYLAHHHIRDQRELEVHFNANPSKTTLCGQKCRVIHLKKLADHIANSSNDIFIIHFNGEARDTNPNWHEGKPRCKRIEGAFPSLDTNIVVEDNSGSS